METEGLKTINQVAEIKGCSVSAVVKALRRGDLKHVRLFGKRLIHESALSAWTPHHGGKREHAGRPKKQPIEPTDTGEEGKKDE